MNPILVQVYLNAFAVVLSWTNPSLNVDGSPCHDLAYVDFQHTMGADTLHAYVPERGREGQMDSTVFQLPPSSVTRTWYITPVCYDTTGVNRSEYGNTVTVTK